MINMYGITETTVHVTYRRIKEEDTDKGSVGRQRVGRFNQSMWLMSR